MSIYFLRLLSNLMYNFLLFLINIIYFLKIYLIVGLDRISLLQLHFILLFFFLLRFNENYFISIWDLNLIFLKILCEDLWNNFFIIECLISYLYNFCEPILKNNSILIFCLWFYFFSIFIDFLNSFSNQVFRFFLTHFKFYIFNILIIKI